MYSQVFRDINQVVGDNNEFLGEVNDIYIHYYSGVSKD